MVNQKVTEDDATLRESTYNFTICSDSLREPTPKPKNIVRQVYMYYCRKTGQWPEAVPRQCLRVQIQSTIILLQIKTNIAIIFKIFDQMSCLIPHYVAFIMLYQVLEYKVHMLINQILFFFETSKNIDIKHGVGIPNFGSLKEENFFVSQSIVISYLILL